MIKKITALFLALFLCFSLMASVAASSAESESEVPLISDGADLLSDEEEAELNERLETFTNENEIQLAIVTTNDIGFYSIESYARNLYNEGYGYSSEKDGILLVRYFDSENDEKEICIYAYGKGKDIFTQEYTQETFDKMQSDIEAQNYASAFGTYIDMATEGAKHKIDFVMIIVFVGIGMLIGAIVITAIISKNKSIVRKETANLYARDGSMAVTGQSETFVRSYVTKTAKAKQNSGSSSGGSRKM